MILPRSNPHTRNAPPTSMFASPRRDKSSIIANPPPASTPWPIERARLGWAKERVVIMGLATAQLRSDR